MEIVALRSSRQTPPRGIISLGGFFFGERQEPQPVPQQQQQQQQAKAGGGSD